MRGCEIGNHRARNIVLKTPLKIVIENNRFFSSDMSSIFFRGETLKWWESGSVEDVLIQNNYFSYICHGGAEHSLLNITPNLDRDYDQNQSYDRNIRFINNTIETFDNRIVWADRVDGLVIKGNKILKTDTAEQLYPKAPVFDFRNCLNVEVSGNEYIGETTSNFFKIDSATKLTTKIENNKGF